MKKDAILSKIRAEKVIALIRADSPDGLLDCARALAAGGLTSIELTMTTPGAIRMLEKATAELPDFLFGLGTVLDAETARIGILAGAKFIVTPALRPEVITLCQRYSVPVFSGAFTPTEIIAAWEAGASSAEATEEIVRDLGEYRSWLDWERVAVNVETAFRSFDADHQPAGVNELFLRMGRLLGRV